MRFDNYRYYRRLARAYMIVGTAGLLAPSLVSSQAAEPASCRRIGDPAARLRCYEGASPVPAAPAEPAVGGGWKLIRAPNPRGGADAVAMIRTADLSRSDPDLAGVMLRCAGMDLEVLTVMLRPRPPRARPKITFRVNATAATFDGSVVSPGALLLLPPAVATLVRGPWQAASEVRITVEDETGKVEGTVPLAGVGAAVASLMGSCARQGA
jgi:hypothetical protein